MTVVKVEDDDVQRAVTQSLLTPSVTEVDEKKLRDDVRATLRKAMAQLSMPLFVPDASKSDELSTVLSLLKALQPKDMREAETSTRMGLPLDMKL
ncbi:MAG: hypothetical protein JST30_02875 [Armatimonadetes bacterium]|nr:hypothetical protein [Armatimonadota bacterium]